VETDAADGNPLTTRIVGLLLMLLFFVIGLRIPGAASAEA
jgi:hypothetical protein